MQSIDCLQLAENAPKCTRFNVKVRKIVCGNVTDPHSSFGLQLPPLANSKPRLRALKPMVHVQVQVALQIQRLLCINASGRPRWAYKTSNRFVVRCADDNVQDP